MYIDHGHVTLVGLRTKNGLISASISAPFPGQDKRETETGRLDAKQRYIYLQ